ncbi:MAG: guanylate kinase [Candidatus Diapherotrites archaeon]|nr:guanylate kinase [Candidatus Diapherotrites archaeon]
MVSKKSVSQASKLFIFTGPSGSGKTTIAENVLKKFKVFKRVVTYTTRAPREGEMDGVDYHFVSRKEFEELLKKDAFLEHAVVYENSYGSLVSEVKELLSNKKSVLFVINVQGALSIMKKFPESVVVFIKAPSIDVLRERLLKRGKDSIEIIKKRITSAKQELKLENKFKYVIVNDMRSLAIKKTEKIIRAELGL